MQYFYGGSDRYLCAVCDRIATIVQVDQGGEQRVCRLHAYHDSIPQSLPEYPVESALRHRLNLRSLLNQSGVA